MRRSRLTQRVSRNSRWKGRLAGGYAGREVLGGRGRDDAGDARGILDFLFPVFGGGRKVVGVSVGVPVEACRHRCHGQAALRPTGRSAHRLQPAEARSSPSLLSQLLRGQFEDEPGSGSPSAQRTRRGAGAAWLVGDIGRTSPPPLADVGPRRLRLRQRSGDA